MKEKENWIDRGLSRVPEDVIILLILISLPIFAIIWKSSTLLILFIIIMFLITIGKYSKAKEIGRQIFVKNLVDWGANKSTVDQMFDLSISNQSEKQYQVAPETHQKVKFSTTELSRFYIESAKSVLSQNKIDEAIAYLNLAIDKDPRNWFAYSMLGTIYLNLKSDADLALKYLLPAIDLDRNHFNQYMNAGVAYIWKEKFDNAIKCLEVSIDIIERDPVARHLPRFVMEYGKCYAFIAESYEKLGKVEEAKSYLKKAIDKLEEIPSRYRDDSINYWLNEIEKRDKRLQDV